MSRAKSYPWMQRRGPPIDISCCRTAYTCHRDIGSCHLAVGFIEGEEKSVVPHDASPHDDESLIAGLNACTVLSTLLHNTYMPHSRMQRGPTCPISHCHPYHQVLLLLLILLPPHTSLHSTIHMIQSLQHTLRLSTFQGISGDGDVCCLCCQLVASHLQHIMTQERSRTTI
jgi:hypothetical protein